jgi:hypothetical protein
MRGIPAYLILRKMDLHSKKIIRDDLSSKPCTGYPDSSLPLLSEISNTMNRRLGVEEAQETIDSSACSRHKNPALAGLSSHPVNLSSLTFVVARRNDRGEGFTLRKTL